MVHILPTMTTGGAERQVAYLLDDPSVDASVICLYRRGSIGDALAARGVRVDLLGMSGWRKALAIPRLALTLRRLAPDVVHTHLLSAQLWGIPGARLAGIPVVVSTEHSLMDASIEGRPLTAWLRRLYLLLERMATRTIAVSDVTAQRLRDWGVAADRITVIENGVDLEGVRYSAPARMRVRQELRIAESTTVVGVVGRLDPVKRIHVVLDAVAAIDSDTVEILIVGQGDLEVDLVEHARRVGLADRAHFVGSRLDVADLLSAMDVLVSPSRDETFGLAIVEALANMLPVIYEQCPAIEALETLPAGAHRIDASLTGPEEVAAIADAIATCPPRAVEAADVPVSLSARYSLAALRTAIRDLYLSQL